MCSQSSFLVLLTSDICGIYRPQAQAQSHDGIVTDMTCMCTVHAHFVISFRDLIFAWDSDITYLLSFELLGLVGMYSACAWL